MMELFAKMVLKAPTRKWDKVFKNRPCKICGRQPLKNLRWYGLLLFKFFKGCLPKILHGLYLNTSSQIFIIYSWQGKKEQREQRTPFSSWYQTYVSLVIKQKGEYQNGRFKQQNTPNFPKKANISYPQTRTPTCAHQGVRNTRFSKNLAPSNRRLLNHVLSLYHCISFSSMFHSI